MHLNYDLIFNIHFSTQLIILKHEAWQIIGSPQMFPDDLNGSVIEMNQHYGTVPSFWNLKPGPFTGLSFVSLPPEEISF